MRMRLLIIGAWMGTSALYPAVAVADVATSGGTSPVVPTTAGNVSAPTTTYSIGTSAGDGSLTVNGGSVLDIQRLLVGDSNGSPATGRVTLSGSGSTLRTRELVDANGQVTPGDVFLGSVPGNSGFLTVNGGARLETLALYSGWRGTGTTVIEGTGTTVVLSPERSRRCAVGQCGEPQEGGKLDSGRQNGSVGDVTIRGGAQVLIQAGGTTQNTNFTGAILRAGRDQGSRGTILIEGRGTEVRMTQTSAPDTSRGGFNSYAAAGQSGTGTITVRDGALVDLSNAGGHMVFNVGSTRTGRGLLVVDGAGTKLNITSTSSSGGAFLNVGLSGVGELQVKNGGTVTLSQTASSGGGLYVGRNSGSFGSVNVSGSGSTLNAGRSANIGTGGTGILTVGSGGTVTATDFYIGSRGTIAGLGTLVGRVNNRGGVVSPGTSPGKLTITGDYIQSSGTLLLEAASASNHDVLDVSGRVALDGGTVAFSFLNNYRPAPGEEIRFIEADGDITIASGVAFSVSGLPADYFSGPFRSFTFEDGVFEVIDTASIQSDAVEATTDTQVRTAVGVSRAAVVNRIRDLSSAFRLTFQQTNQTGALIPRDQNGLAAGDMAGSAGMGLGVWVDGSWTRLDDSTPREQLDGSLYTILAGVDYLVSDRLVVGAAAGYEDGTIEVTALRGDIDSASAVGSLYAAYRATEGVTPFGQVTFGMGENEVEDTRFGPRVTGTHDTWRVAATGGVIGKAAWDPIEVSGTIAYTYAHQDNDSYTASNGMAVNPEDETLHEFRADMELALPLGSVEPFATIGMDHDFSDRRNPDDDRTGAQAGGGVRVNLGDSFSATAYASIEIGREFEDTLQAGGALRYSF